LRFAQEFVRDLNGTQAAIRAGYSRSTASEIASRLVKKSHVDAAIARRLAQIEAKCERKLHHVISELISVGFSNMGDYISFAPAGEPYIEIGEHLTRGQLAAIQEVVIEDFTDGRGESARKGRRIRIKLRDKQRALELLGKHFGAFAARGVLDAENTSEKLDDLERGRRVASIIDSARRAYERHKMASEPLVTEQMSAPIADTSAMLKTRSAAPNGVPEVRKLSSGRFMVARRGEECAVTFFTQHEEAVAYAETHGGLAPTVPAPTIDC
jgi:phage terminase small subunit